MTGETLRIIVLNLIIRKIVSYILSMQVNAELDTITDKNKKNNHFVNP